MIKPEDEIIINFDTGCTVEEAVAKMLGWLQGPKRLRTIRINENGISADQMPYLPTLEDSLEAHLIELRDAVNQDYVDAVNEFPSANSEDEKRAKHEEICQKNKIVKNFDDLIEKAFQYKLDIKRELSKGKSSALAIDKKAKKKSSKKHITITSLHDWALEKYGISIEPTLNQRPASNHQQEQIIEQQEQTVEQQGEDHKHDKGDWSSETKRENVYTTFALLVEAFVEIAPNKYKHNDKPNVKNIAEHIEKLAKQANNNYFLSGQRSESIRKLIAEAISIKQQTVDKKGSGK